MEYLIIHRITTLIFALVLGTIGSIALIRKKPLIINSKWFVSILVLILVVPTVPMAIRGIGDSWFMLGISLALIGYLFYFLKGYFVLGADGADFQRVFIETLREENYQFEETFVSIKIIEPEIELSIAFQSWTGTGQIRLKSKGNYDTFEKIINRLKTKYIKPNRTAPFVQIIICLILIFIELRMPMP